MPQDDDLEQRPMVYDNRVQYLPIALEKNEAAKMIKMAVDAAIAIDACVSIIQVNQIQKDSHARLIVSEQIEEALLFAITGLANYIKDAGCRCLDKMDKPLQRPEPIKRTASE